MSLSCITGRRLSYLILPSEGSSVWEYKMSDGDETYEVPIRHTYFSVDLIDAGVAKVQMSPNVCFSATFVSSRTLPVSQYISVGILVWWAYSGASRGNVRYLSLCSLMKLALSLNTKPLMDMGVRVGKIQPILELGNKC
jgi:hypothetical protein